MGAKITVVGSINMDIVATTDRLPTAGETVGGGRLHREPGGKGANQAAAAARLGARTRMIGAVGVDADGTAMLASLEQAGVDTSGIGRLEEPSGTALINVDACGENQIAVCPGANSLIDISEVVFEADEAVLTQLEIPMEIIEELAAKVPGYLAINAAPALPLSDAVLTRADLVIVNETEYDLLPQLQTHPNVAVTYGARGAALLSHGQQIAFAPGVPTTVVNTVGAGDAFCAALLLGLRQDLPAEKALAGACGVGAAAVADPASQPRLAPLVTYLG